jgi:hypothetical protein
MALRLLILTSERALCCVVSMWVLARLAQAGTDVSISPHSREFELCRR